VATVPKSDGSSKYHRIVKACDSFHDVSGMGSREAASLIREMEIDILVDLNGQTLGWRPAILKYRPAPVIATFLGYAGTTGADFIDYIIGDPHVTPFALASAMSEKIVQLPDSFWPTDPMTPQPEPLSRAQAGLPQDAFVFCCFNSNHKIRPAIFDIWMRLLKDVEGSVLWLLEGNASIRGNLASEAAARGVAQNRLVFAGRTSSDRHLARQKLADLFLDTLPYNAHTTASDALWAGLPLLTCRGTAFPGRVAASLLTAAGMPELIMESMADYEARAIALGRDPKMVDGLKEKLARNRPNCSLFDTDRFREDIEMAYTTMWQAWQRGETPKAFAVEPTLAAGY